MLDRNMFLYYNMKQISRQKDYNGVFSMNRNIEKKIYEFLGIKTFRKLCFKLSDIVSLLTVNVIFFPITRKMSKKEKEEILDSDGEQNNYIIGRIRDIDDIKKFKKWLFVNAGIHILLLYELSPFILSVLTGTASLLTTINTFAAVIGNLYCIMLQRYNCIRINQFIKKVEPQYERRKNIIKDELRKKDKALPEHTYKIVNENGKENNMDFDNLINSLSMEELRYYRDNLEVLQSSNQELEEEEFYINLEAEAVPKEKQNKLLKLKFMRNSN